MSKRREFRPAGVDALEERLVLSTGTAALQALAQTNAVILAPTTVFAQNFNYVNSLFIFIGRVPNPGGVAFHAQQLTSGKVSRLDTVSQFLNTSQFHNAETNFLFNFLLGRAPSAGDLALFNNFLNTPKNSFISETALILGSPEYFNNAGGTNQDWITAVYQDILGRAPDAGAQFWLNGLAAGVSRQTVASQILRTPEGAFNLVSLAYAQVLQRAPDAGAQVFVNSIVNGGSFEAVVGRLLASQEFFLGVQAGTLGNNTFGTFLFP